MKITHHPAEYIKPEFAALLRDFAVNSEQMKQLHPIQLGLIQKQKWFRLFVSKSHGGLELSLPEALHLEEALAWADGSAGWTVTLCSGAGWFAGFLDPELLSEVFSDPAVCIAGSGKSSGIAKKMGDAYEITGSWDYATGAAHATAFTANCIIEENGVLLQKDDGMNIIQSFLFFKDEVIVHKNWNSMGMIATGSNRFEVKRLVVKTNRSFQIDGRFATLPGSIYQYPFLQFAETTLAVNSSGMAVRFMDLCEIWFRPSSTRTKMLVSARKQLDEARGLFYNLVDNSWKECLKKNFVPPDFLEAVSQVSRRVASTAREVVNELYPCCGLKAANLETEINRVWRNLHTAGQHSLLNACGAGFDL